MNRRRRVTATVLAATGLLGAAGAAAATVSGLVGGESPMNDASVPAAATSGRHVQSPEEAAAARASLEEYIASMSERANRLGEQVTAAEARLFAARTVRARLIARVRAQTAALARARAAAEESTAIRAEQSSSAPATHTSTGASSGGNGDDDDHHGHDGGDGGDDD